MADGGEGRVDAFLQRGAVRKAVRVCGPLGKPVDAARCREFTTCVANVLLPFASGTGGLSPVDPQLIEFARTDIAAAAGCVNEAAARAIAQLEDAGALRREHGRIRYLDRGRLLHYTDSAKAVMWNDVCLPAPESCDNVPPLRELR